MQIIYELDRLLANPRIFYAIANQFDGPDGHTIRTAFFDLLEHDLDDFELAEDCIFGADEVCFRCDDESDGKFEIILSNGMMSVLEPIDGETRAMITSDGDLAATSAIYQRLVQAIEETDPEFSGDVVLCSPPTPGNRYLRSDDGDHFSGSFHLLSNPEKEYAFKIEVVDVQTDDLKAFIKPL
jgi:hypothetical protein